MKNLGCLPLPSIFRWQTVSFRGCGISWVNPKYQKVEILQIYHAFVVFHSPKWAHFTTEWMSHFPLPWTFKLLTPWNLQGKYSLQKLGGRILWKNHWVLPMCVDRIYSPKGKPKPPIQGDIVDGSKIRRSPVDIENLPCFIEFHVYQVVITGISEPSTVLIQKVLFGWPRYGPFTQRWGHIDGCEGLPQKGGRWQREIELRCWVWIMFYI